MNGKKVADVPGIVTAVGPAGFWMQSTTPDNDPATSEGVYVYTRSAPAVAPGDDVTVDANVTEFRPGGASGNDNLTTTELIAPAVTTTSSGNPLLQPVVIGVDRVAPQQTVESGNPGSVEKPGTVFDPTKNALDFDESMEGMRVSLRDANAVGPTNVSYGELPVVPGQRVSATRSRAGGVVYGGYDQPNAARLILSDSLLPKGSMPVADVGDTLPGETVGVLDYNFSNFQLLLTAKPALHQRGLQREVTKRAGITQLAVATFNVENLAPSDPATKYQRLAGQITHNLASPDILTLEEIQDSSGATNDGVVDCTDTTDTLLAAIKAAGGPSYQARWINPTDGADGGQPGGNIRQAFLYRTDRGLRFVDKPGGTAASSVAVTGSGRRTSITQSPGRIDPTNAAWTDSRKPLVGEFSWRGSSVFVVANHFTSKGGDDPLMGRWQQPQRSSETQRVAQARSVRGFVDTLLAADAKANLVVLGDLNDFEFSQTANTLVGQSKTALLDLPRTLPAAERYTYDYEGNSQVLDHILISPSLAQLPWPIGPLVKGYAYDVVHTNAEFHDQDSDHDPQVVRLNLVALH